MINYGKVKSSIRPPAIDLTAGKVFIASNIEEYEDNIDNRVINGYQYDYSCYTKDEYILLMIQNSEDINTLREELNAAKILLGVE